MSKATLYSQSDEDYIIKHYSDTPTSKIAEHLGRTYHAIITKANVLRKDGFPVGEKFKEPTEPYKRKIPIDIPSGKVKNYILDIMHKAKHIARFTLINREQVEVILDKYRNDNYTFELQVIR